MNKAIIAVGLLTLTSAAVAHADYNSDVVGKSVRCTGPQIVVVIDRARTEITVINAIDSGHPEKYPVVNTDTDGDTFRSYISRGHEAILSFDDQGDTLTYKGQRSISIHCAN